MRVVAPGWEHRMKPHRNPILVLLCAWTLLLAGCTCKARGPSKKRDKPPVVILDPESEGPEPVPEKEPNATRGTAQQLTTEAPIQGALQQKEDQDWYAVKVSEGGQVLRATLSGVAGLDMLLEAFDNSGKRLMRVDNSKEGGGEVLVNLTVNQGLYYLRVSQHHTEPVSGGTYQINYRLRPREDGEEEEPNWKAALAPALVLDGEAVGFLGWRTDTDWYRVEATDLDPGGRLRIEYDGLDNVRANLSVRDSSGAVIQERWSRSGEGVMLANIAPLTGADKHFYVVLRCRSDSNVETRYYLRALATLPTGPTEAEPNENVSQATVLQAGASMSGILGDTQDRDVYLLSASPPTPVRVEVVPPLGLDLALAVLDQQGKVLRRINEGGSRKAEVIPALHLDPPGALIQVHAPRRGATTQVVSYHIKTKVLARANSEMEHEPNSDEHNATPWPLGQKEMRGHIHPRKDVDLFRLTPRATARTLWARAPAGLALKVEVLGPAGTVLARAQRAAGKERLELPLEANKPFLLRVTNPSGAANADEWYVLGLGQ